MPIISPPAPTQRPANATWEQLDAFQPRLATRLIAALKAGTYTGPIPVIVPASELAVGDVFVTDELDMLPIAQITGPEFYEVWFDGGWGFAFMADEKVAILPRQADGQVHHG